MKASRFALAAVFLFIAHAAAAQTADEIIEKSIAAMGGRAALEKVKTRLMTGELSIGTPVGDISGTLEMYAAVPNKQRTVIKADLTSLGAGPLLIDQRFDGTAGYAIDTMQGNREITGTQLENMRAQGFPHPFLNYKASGMSVKLGAKEQIQGKDMYVLTFEPTAGLPIKQYVDAATFLPARTIVTADIPQMGRMEQMIDPSDYRAVDGVQIAHKLVLTNAMQSITMTIKKVENNLTLDEKMFVKP